MNNSLAFEQAMYNIEKRFGVSFMKYMGFEGNKSEIEKKIKRSMQKETLKLATQFANEK